MLFHPNEYELLAYMALPPEREEEVAGRGQQLPREAANEEGAAPPPAGSLLRRTLRRAAQLWRRL